MVSTVAQLGAQPRGDALQQQIAERMAERVVDRFEIVEIDAEHREAAAAALQVGDHLLHAQAQQDPVGQRGQRIVMRHVGDARFGRLALGDVDRGNQRGALALIGQMAEEDRDVDGRAVGLAVPPGPAGVILRQRAAEVPELEAFVG